MIHLMELPNPDPLSGRPEHGGRDRHTCIAIKDVAKLKAILEKEGNHICILSFYSCKSHMFVGSLLLCNVEDDDLNVSGIPYTLSKSGRPAIFFRDPDANALELVQLE